MYSVLGNLEQSFVFSIFIKCCMLVMFLGEFCLVPPVIKLTGPPVNAGLSFKIAKAGTDDSLLGYGQES